MPDFCDASATNGNGSGRELYDSVGREPTLRLDGDVLGREAGHRIWEFREAVR